MTRWEYQLVQKDPNGEWGTITGYHLRHNALLNDEQVLNGIGSEGWELLTIETIDEDGTQLYYFKRPVDSPPADLKGKLGL